MYKTVPTEPAHPADAELDFTGLTKREVFASQMLASIGAWMPLPSGQPFHLTDTNLAGDYALQARAEWAVRQADALIAALNKEDTTNA